MYKSVGVLFMCKIRKEVFLVQYNLIKSQQIKIKNTLCMQCGQSSCLMLTDNVCPAFAKTNPKIIKIKEDNHNEKYKETYIIGIDHGYGNMKTAN